MANLSEFMTNAMAKVREMIDVDAVVGKPIEAGDGIVLIPVSKVVFGFASGGTDSAAPPEADSKKSVRYGAGSGMGVNIVPVAFIVVQKDNVRMIYVTPPTNTTLDKLVDMVPLAVDRITQATRKKEHDAAQEV